MEIGLCAGGKKEENSMSHIFIRYRHHNLMWGRTDLRGTHREHCICYECNNFQPDSKTDNCPIAQGLYEYDQRHGVTTPVFECAHFKPLYNATIIVEE